MPRTFADSLAYDAANVFLNTDEFAETATHYPAGDVAAGVPIAVVVHRDDETNAGLGHGDGNMIDDPNGGSEINTYILLQMLSSVSVTFEGQNTRPSRFLLADGTACVAIRREGYDDAMQTIRCNSLTRRADGRVEKP